MRRKIAIDFGTNNTVISLNGKIVISEPTIVAVSAENERILAAGAKAREMLGKAPETIIPILPVSGGVISNFTVAKAYLKMQLERLAPSFELFRPDIMIATPAGSTSVERRAALEVALSIGAAHAYIVDATLAAAIGAGVAVSSAAGNVVLHMGADVTEAAIISLGGIIASDSRRIGGNTLNNALKKLIKDKYGLVIGDTTAQRIKEKLAHATAPKAEEELEVSGRDLSFGMPRNCRVTAKDVSKAIAPLLEEFSNVIETALEKTPPELSSDVIDKGIVLTGGGAVLSGFDKYLTEHTGVPAHIAEDPEYCVVRGAATVLENLNLWRMSVMTKS